MCLAVLCGFPKHDTKRLKVWRSSPAALVSPPRQVQQQENNNQWTLINSSLYCVTHALFMTTKGVEAPHLWQAPTSAGKHYFVCGVDGHCGAPMKAVIEVKNDCWKSVCNSCTIYQIDKRIITPYLLEGYCCTCLAHFGSQYESFQRAK